MILASTRTREMTFVSNGNDDDVIISYITDMDLGEDSDSLSANICSFLSLLVDIIIYQAIIKLSGSEGHCRHTLGHTWATFGQCLAAYLP